MPANQHTHSASACSPAAVHPPALPCPCSVMPEALEKWPVAVMQKLLPRHMQLIEQINDAWLASVKVRKRVVCAHCLRRPAGGSVAQKRTCVAHGSRACATAMTHPHVMNPLLALQDHAASKGAELQAAKKAEREAAAAAAKVGAGVGLSIVVQYGRVWVGGHANWRCTSMAIVCACRMPVLLQLEEGLSPAVKPCSSSCRHPATRAAGGAG